MMKYYYMMIKTTAIKRFTTFLDSWLTYRMEQEDIPGFSVAVGVDGRIIFSQAYGYANVESKEVLTNNHYFQVASQTKMLTAIAVMQLVEAETVILDDPAATYLPWLTQHKNNKFHKITVRQLLCHRAGIVRGNHSNDYWLYERPFPTPSELQKAVLDAELAFTPGAGTKYSNLNYGLLGMLIEAASGQTYEECKKLTRYLTS